MFCLKGLLCPIVYIREKCFEPLSSVFEYLYCIVLNRMHKIEVSTIDFADTTLYSTQKYRVISSVRLQKEKKIFELVLYVDQYSISFYIFSVYVA